MKRWFRTGVAALAAAALAGCAAQGTPAGGNGAAQQVQAVGGKPAMWKLADSDTTIYLFGTIHLLPEGTTWRTPAFDAAVNGADELVLEIADVGNQQASAAAMMKLGVSPNLPPLVQRVPEEKRAALTQMVNESGIPMAVLDRLETWAAGLALMGVTFRRLGLNPELGVEQRLTGGWKAGGRPIRGLETVEEQLGIFDGLDEEAQRAFLVAVLEAPEDTKAQFQKMLDSWLKGDLKGISASFDDETQLSPELRAVLMDARNAKWAEWLAGRLDQPGTVFVAVGAGHLAGEHSAQSFLEKKGLKATRVQ